MFSDFVQLAFVELLLGIESAATIILGFLFYSYSYALVGGNPAGRDTLKAEGNRSGTLLGFSRFSSSRRDPSTGSQQQHEAEMSG